MCYCSLDSRCVKFSAIYELFCYWTVNFFQSLNDIVPNFDTQPNESIHFGSAKSFFTGHGCQKYPIPA